MRQVVHVDDRAPDPCFCQAIEGVVDESPPANLDQGFRERIRDRAHSHAEPGRQHHSRMGRRDAASVRRSAGIEFQAASPQCNRVDGHDLRTRSRSRASRTTFGLSSVGLRAAANEPRYHRFSLASAACARFPARYASIRGRCVQVLWLAVPFVEAREDAEDLRVALSAHDRVGARKGGRVEPRIAGAPFAGIKAQKPQLEIGRDGNPGVLEERRRHRRRGSQHGVLKVDESDPAHALGAPRARSGSANENRAGSRCSARDDLDQDLRP